MPDIICPQHIKYLDKFRQPDDLIVEMEAYAAEHKIPILDAHAGALLEQVIMMTQPRRVLEIGTAIAYSSIRMARVLPEGSELDTIEISKDNIPLAKENIKKSGAEDKINLIQGDALKVIPELEKKYDLVFLDADKEDYDKLYEMSLEKLNKGGALFIDNLLWHGYAASEEEIPENYKTSTKIIREFNEKFMNEKRLKTTIHTVGDGIGIGINL